MAQAAGVRLRWGGRAAEDGVGRERHHPPGALTPPKAKGRQGPGGSGEDRGIGVGHVRVDQSGNPMSKAVVVSLNR
ncbi:hypothetical protein GCM10023083_04870 [Streptomyces phyllanthi]